MENRDGVILGLVIGIILAISLLNRRNLQTIQTTASIIRSQESDLNWTPIDIPRVDDLLSKLQTQVYDSRLNQIESQLEKTTLHLEEATSKLLDLNNAIDKIQTTAIPTPQIQPKIQPQIQPVFIQQQPPNVIVHPIENKSIRPIENKSIRPIENKSIRPIENKSIQPAVQAISTVNKNDNKIDQNQLTQSQDTIYKNNEKWEIKRGPDGRIKSLNIIRDIKKLEK